MIKSVVLAAVFSLAAAACSHGGFGPFQSSATPRCEGLSGSALDQCRRDAGYSTTRSDTYRGAPTTDDPSVLRGTGGSEQQGAR